MSLKSIPILPTEAVLLLAICDLSKEANKKIRFVTVIDYAYENYKQFYIQIKLKRVDENLEYDTFRKYCYKLKDSLYFVRKYIDVDYYGVSLNIDILKNKMFSSREKPSFFKIKSFLTKKLLGVIKTPSVRAEAINLVKETPVLYDFFPYAKDDFPSAFKIMKDELNLNYKKDKEKTLRRLHDMLSKLKYEIR